MQIINNIQNRNIKEEIDMIRIKTAFQSIKASNLGDKKNCDLEIDKNYFITYCVKAFKRKT